MTYLIKMYRTHEYGWTHRSAQKVHFEIETKEKVDRYYIYQIAKKKYPNLLLDNYFEVKDTLPNGWKKLEGALTAPNGYYWANNCKSRWDKKYESALIRE